MKEGGCVTVVLMRLMALLSQIFSAIIDRHDGVGTRKAAYREMGIILLATIHRLLFNNVGSRSAPDFSLPMFSFR